MTLEERIARIAREARVEAMEQERTHARYCPMAKQGCKAGFHA